MCVACMCIYIYIYICHCASPKHGYHTCTIARAPLRQPQRREAERSACLTYDVVSLHRMSTIATLV